MKNRKRNIRISVRLNPQEHRKLKEKCLIAGLSIEALVRSLIADCEIRPRPPDTYRELAREVAAVGNNLNQIAHSVNSTGYVSRTQMEQVTAIMTQIWKLMQEHV